jgi:DNA-binding winged helix-turn-helix (wHTH) protein
MHRASPAPQTFLTRQPPPIHHIHARLNHPTTPTHPLHQLHSTSPCPTPPTPRRYRFGAFEADTATGELRRQGIRIKLNAQPFQVLTLLLAHPGELLTREQIAAHLWPDGTFVDFDHGVNSAINRIREALGDTAASPRFIETLARRGYRFLAPVEIHRP